MRSTRGRKKLPHHRRGDVAPQPEEFPQPEPLQEVDGGVVEAQSGSNDEAHSMVIIEAVAEEEEEVVEEEETEEEEEVVEEPNEEETCLVLAERFGDAAKADGVDGDSDCGDDMWNDDMIPDPLSSDDDDDDPIRERIEEDNPDEILALGKTFGCAVDFKHALLRYSLKTGYDIKLFISTQIRICAVCSDTTVQCPWRIYCSYEKRRHKLQVKVFVNEHVCIRSGYTKMLKRSTIAQLFDERLRLNPRMTPKEMAAEIKRTYNLIVTDDQCRKAKTKLFRERQASHEAHFSRIWDYQAELQKSNRGITVEIETIPGPTPGSKQRFDRFFVCFTAQRESWQKTCRPIIGLDGAFLKWDIKGHLLAAIGRDGDNRIVPIAWAVVEVENDTNWDWFVRLLRKDLNLADGRTITVISDKQKGLVKAVHNVLPQAEHRMCARHILHNWKRDTRDIDLERLFWKVARSYTTGEYEDNMDALKKYNQGAYDTLLRTNPHSWSRAFFRVGSCCNDILNNLNESFNRTIREARRKPLLDMLEDIRRKCMVRNEKRSLIANRLKTRFTKRAHAEIEATKTKSRDCIRFCATGNRHEVHQGGVGYCVDMNDRTCGCRKWQLVGIPCIHAICVITAKKERMDDYVSHYYTTHLWQQTYAQGIQPVQGMKLWPRLNRLPVLPPGNRLNNRGRPCTHARRKGAYEASSSNATKLSRLHRVMTCSNCKEEGHNKLTCANPRVESQPKRPRGRPRLVMDHTPHGQPQPHGQSQGSQVEPSQGLHVGPSQGSQHLM